MSSAAEVPAAVAHRLDALFGRMRAEVAEYGPDAALLLDTALTATAGGKRLRARFCHAGWHAVTRTAAENIAEPDALWELCTALEVFQAAALVHDDLIDNSDTRRGRPASHRALENRHGLAGWRGDAAAFGRASALLLGDLLVAWSDDLLEAAIAEDPAAHVVRKEYARMRRDVTLGQFLDIAEESAWSTYPDSTHAERALRVVTLKSARYSVEQPLLLGALLAGATAEQQSALRGFGHPIGMAFQLRDDLLGVFGDESVTGKPAGDDLREGKRTVLIAFARENLAEAERAELDATLGNPLDEAQIAALQELIRHSGAVDRVEEMIASATREALSSLTAAAFDTEAATALRLLAGAATSRVA